MIGQLTSKVAWSIGGVFLVIFLYGFAVKTVFKPNSIAGELTEVPEVKEADRSANSGNNENSDIDSEPIAQADEVALYVPTALEPGGVLKVYANRDRFSNPDPAFYSPSKIVKTSGLALTANLDPKSSFQEVSGYFLVKEDGNYNFAVAFSKRDIPSYEQFNIKINGVPLGSNLGGKVYLEKGYHQISIFSNVSRSYAKQVDGLILSWAREGQQLTPVKVYRER